MQRVKDAAIMPPNSNPNLIVFSSFATARFYTSKHLPRKADESGVLPPSIDQANARTYFKPQKPDANFNRNES